VSTTCEKLREHVLTLPIVDTHEHVWAREDQRETDTDVLAEYLRHYFSCDLVSAGLEPRKLEYVRDPGAPLQERWKLAEPYWEAARGTGYGRALDIAARDLYGFERIDGSTVAPLDEAFRARRAKGGCYRWVLREKSNIRVSILDKSPFQPGWDADFFRPVVRLDDFVMVSNLDELEGLAKRAGMEAIHDLADLEEACRRALEKALEAGAIGLKSGLAYRRPLEYRKVTRAAAERELLRLFSPKNTAPKWGARRGATDKLQDYMMHQVCRLADERGLAFQIHTGIQEGNGNYIRHSDPTLLANLFLEYPNARFDVFHIGYPYHQQLSVLAKNFRNVFIDFCWAHAISPTASVRALVEYLDAVPANKISGFGGDYNFLDGIYGHQVLARENIARALAIKVDEGWCDLARAQALAKALLFENPARIFGLKDLE
jgi:hypothetical protein